MDIATLLLIIIQVDKREITMEVYELVKTIGGGNFGQVYLARHRLEGKHYVLKKVKTRDMSARDRENTENEVRLLQKLRHSNIVGYKDSFLDREQFLNIVMVYCEGGDMYSKVKNAKGKNFTEDQILEWFAQIVLAIHYLHERRILHRDLKTQNIFLKNKRIRVGDFGIAKVLDSTRDFANTCIGTPYYMSPELFRNKPYSYKSDIWALGCVLYEMCNLRHAFDAQSINGLAMKILRGSYPPIAASYSKPLKDLITKMLSIKASSRPTILDLVNKPFIRKKVVQYLNECINTPPEQLDPSDVDDVVFVVPIKQMHVDSLKEQAAQLGIVEVLKQSPRAELPPPEVEERKGRQAGGEKHGVQKKTTNKKPEEGEVKYKQLKKVIKEKQKMEDQLKQLKDERKRKLEEFKQKMKNKKIKGKPVKVETSTAGSTEVSSEVSKLKESKKSIAEPETNESKVEPKVGKPPKYKNPKADPTIHRLNHSEFNKIFQRKVKNRNTSMDNKNSKKKDNHSKSGFATGSSREGSSEKNDSTAALPVAETNDQKQKILHEKEQRKKEERERIENALQQIRFENYIARQKAKEKEAQMMRPSSGMKHSFGVAPSKAIQPEIEGIYARPTVTEEEKKSERDSPKKIEEQYGMEEEKDDEDSQEALEDIQEEIEENESDKEEIEKKVNLLKTMTAQMKTIKEQIIEKTQRIEEEIAGLIENSAEAIPETPAEEVEDGPGEDKKDPPSSNPSKKIEDLFENLSSESEEMNSDNERLGEIAPPEKEETRKLEERIKLLKHRCEAGIGNILFERAYNTLKEEVKDRDPENVRTKLVTVLGAENIGFYAIIDQILFLEGISAQQFSQLMTIILIFNYTVLRYTINSLYNRLLLYSA
eukprot:TRINITY_DN374_c0_g1_i1.p1 TRINITY_DN374_c0_g1~~TRINITY_DN374_c0_g1_i1.p1  ORF type:complete len:878 (+),score=169.96 TRINITY_DN374_c0_g1_i1:2421-5054(+)